MTLISLIIALLIVGAVLWAVNAMPGIDPTIKRIIVVVVVLGVLLWLLKQAGGSSILGTRIF